MFSESHFSDNSTVSDKYCGHPRCHSSNVRVGNGEGTVICMVILETVVVGSLNCGSVHNTVPYHTCDSKLNLKSSSFLKIQRGVSTFRFAVP